MYSPGVSIVNKTEARDGIFGGFYEIYPPFTFLDDFDWLPEGINERKKL